MTEAISIAVVMGAVFFIVRHLIKNKAREQWKTKEKL